MPWGLLGLSFVCIFALFYWIDRIDIKYRKKLNAVADLLHELNMFKHEIIEEKKQFVPFDSDAFMQEWSDKNDTLPKEAKKILYDWNKEEFRSIINNDQLDESPFANAKWMKEWAIRSKGDNILLDQLFHIVWLDHQRVKQTKYLYGNRIEFLASLQSRRQRFDDLIDIHDNIDREVFYIKDLSDSLDKARDEFKKLLETRTKAKLTG
ncbi:hypothetical protein BG46_25085 [Brucella anthropi]|nr:hypothetical protein BG46_25085 [Brucella anthropi]